MMNRDLVIDILLILAGIVLAFALFGAGALWKSKKPTDTSDLVLPCFGSSFIFEKHLPDG